MKCQVVDFIFKIWLKSMVTEIWLKYDQIVMKYNWMENEMWLNGNDMWLNDAFDWPDEGWVNT